MPVVRIDLKRFTKMVGADRKRILQRLPYVGLDIESIDGDLVRVEYSPNRPDFGTDFGIARALRGLLGKETGLQRFPTSASAISVSVDRRLSRVRPFIACASVTGLHLNEEDVRQIISLQEDLHNGLGRKRKTVAIGLHDLDAVNPPIFYRAVEGSFRFVPLDAQKSMTVASILSDTIEGRAYGGALGGSKLYPMIVDSKGIVLSFPPIINGKATRVTSRTRRMFIDVTGTDSKACDDVLAVMSTTLAEAGGRLGTVAIKHPGRTRRTPNLTPIELPLNEALVESLLGLHLTRREVLGCLAKSRLGVKGRKVLGPRYRIDLLHPVDVAEEVALGYGVDRMVPVYPESKQPGRFNPFEEFLDSVSTIMSGSGMIELMTFELTDSRSLYSNFRRPSSTKIAVENPKSSEHSLLRDALIPSLLSSLTSNVKSDYPQRVFEIGRVFARTKDGVSEAWHLGCLVAHSQSSFTEAKMYLESAIRVLAGKEAVATESLHWAFTPGRCAAISVDETDIGHVGEIEPAVIDGFGLGVPVAGFEIDLSNFYKLLK
jgi:phenylalanyl-tRNA synthetase beta chain